MAAGKAIGGIAGHVSLWEPNKDEMQEVNNESKLQPIKEDDDLALDSKDSKDLAKVPTHDDDGRLSFGIFDPVQVLKNGEKLLGSAGKVEF